MHRSTNVVVNHRYLDVRWTADFDELNGNWQKPCFYFNFAVCNFQKLERFPNSNYTYQITLGLKDKIVLLDSNFTKLWLFYIYFINKYGSVPTKDMQTSPLYAVLIPLSWKMRVLLRWIKKQFYDFYFLSFVEIYRKLGWWRHRND